MPIIDGYCFLGAAFCAVLSLTSAWDSKVKRQIILRVDPDLTESQGKLVRLENSEVDPAYILYALMETGRCHVWIKTYVVFFTNRVVSYCRCVYDSRAILNVIQKKSYSFNMDFFCKSGA